MVLEKILESPLDCKEVQPVHPKEISPECSLEGLMLKVKLQYFSHLIQRADSFEKILMLRKIEGIRRRGQKRMRWLASITVSEHIFHTWGDNGEQSSLERCSPWGCKESDET